MNNILAPIKDRSCFIIMPFSEMKVGKDTLDEKELKYIYDNIIKKAVESHQLEGKISFSRVSRYEQKTGSIIKGIVRDLKESDLVIADVTGLNGNVMYELGVRHSLKRGTIMIAEKSARLPTDLRDYGVVKYEYSKHSPHELDSNYKIFEEELHLAIQEIFQNDNHYDSPVLDYIKTKEFYQNEEAIQKLKHNLIIAKYIKECFERINSEISNHQDNDSLFISQITTNLNSFYSAIRELKINFEDYSLFTKIHETENLMEDIIKTFTMPDILSGIINVENPDLIESGVFNDRIGALQFLDVKNIKNPFDSLSGKLISVRDIFSTKGIIKNEFINALSTYNQQELQKLEMNSDDFNELLI